MIFLNNLKYSGSHEWLKVEGEEARIGITEYAVSELGDIAFVDIETEGENLEQGEAFGTIEAVKTVTDVYMPVSGKVIEINPAVINNPELINKDCYGDGWLIRIKMNNSADANNLLNAEQYAEIAKH